MRFITWNYKNDIWKQISLVKFSVATESQEKILN